MSNQNKKEDLAIVIIAAGLGTRMKSPLPKCIQPIGGLSMVVHSIRLAKQCTENITIIIGDDMPDMEACLKNENVPYIYQKERLGTAHAVLQAAEKLKDCQGNLLILYGDSPLLEMTDIINLLEKKEQEKATIAVIGFYASNPEGYGRLLLKDNTLLGIIEDKDANAEQKRINLCNGGIMAGILPTMFDILKEIQSNNAKNEYYLTDVVQLATQKGYTCAYTTVDENNIMGANTMEELANLEHIYQKKLRKKALAMGVRMTAPDTVMLSAETTFGSNVSIEPYVVLIGTNIIGDNVHIKSFCHIENAVIDSGAKIGPQSRLRTGAVIGSESHIGNFVEIKNTKLEAKVKVNHLAYLGDATIGTGTNIGAGTIICNYDGIKKHHTTIGKNSFIGSNSALVAPITIGDNVRIGAGTTLRNNVESGTLVVAKPMLIEKK